MKFEGDVNVCR